MKNYVYVCKFIGYTKNVGIISEKSNGIILRLAECLILPMPGATKQ